MKNVMHSYIKQHVLLMMKDKILKELMKSV